MDTRFTRIWHVALERKTGGEPFDDILASMSSADLVEALAGAACEDPVAANAIATAILNRLHRARMLGAMLGLGMFTLVAGLIMFMVDFYITGTIGLVETAPVSPDVAGIGIMFVLLSIVLLGAAWLIWNRMRGPSGARRSR